MRWTAPLHGFEGKDDYYDRCSSVHFLKDIERPTLIVNALDDPFMTPEVIPDESQLSDQVTLEVSDSGGHVGFVSGGTPWRPSFYLPGAPDRFPGAPDGEARTLGAPRPFLHRQPHAALAIDLEDLDLDDVAFSKLVADLFDPFVRDLRDMHEAILARQNCDERPRSP